jgi:acyl transferase domain-containing protein
MALAGGVSISVPVHAGYLYQEGGMLSADGHCRPFDADASGTTFNDGAGVVVLRRLEDAVADNDRIYAVIRGCAVNNDGSDKVSYTAPSVTGQADVIRSALEHADVDPRTVGFVETHGTATPLGDPIEIAALRRAFGVEDGPAEKTCVIGSVKSNIGHLVHAAGVTGFIKAVLAVYHGKIPPTLHFRAPNPRLELDAGPFHVNNKLLDWRPDGPRRAGISAFGVGGTNAHVIVEEPPRVAAQLYSDALGVLCVSAKDKDALARATEQLQVSLEQPAPELTHASLLHTLQFGREPLAHRRAWITESIADARDALTDRTRVLQGRATVRRDIGFMFTGQGAQRPDMGLALRERCPVFREWFDRGLAYLHERLGLDLATFLFTSSGADNESVEATRIAQPSLFLFEFSLAKALATVGVEPRILLGHSIGEFTAAALSGVFTFEDALAVVVARGAAMQEMPTGSMLAVYVSEENARQFTTADVCIAAINAPELTVLSGPDEAIAALTDELEKRGMGCKPLRTSHAFHSQMMEPAVSKLATVLEGIELNAPRIPIVSTATGALLTDAQATDPGYWARQLREPVRFAAAVEAVVAAGPFVLVEVGPGTTLTMLAGQCRNEDRPPVCAASPDTGVADSALRHVWAAAATCWVNGATVDFAAHWRDLAPVKAALPTYPFARTRCWVDAAAGQPAVAPTVSGPLEPPAIAPASTATTLPERNLMNESASLASLRQRVLRVFEDMSGYELADADPDSAFSELGFDSLLLTQVSTALKQEFDVGVTFRELMEDYTTLGELTAHLSGLVAVEAPAGEAEGSAATVLPAIARPADMPMPGIPDAATAPGDAHLLIQRQLELMQLQLQILGGRPAAGPVAAAPRAEPAAQPAVAARAPDAEPKAKRTPGTRIEKTKSDKQLTRAQQKYLDKVIRDYTTATAASRAFVQKHRRRLADPRTVSGFTPLLKEMVYPIVTNRSKGSKLTDLDGREYIDITNAFGPIFFGHSPDFVTEAVLAQIAEGIETGPQSPLAGEVAELFCELTGNERVAFANTGSEAVLAALRLARTVTGREKVVIFEGAYHGIFDEVVVRPGRAGAGLPAAPGIPRAMTSNIIVLPYGTDETLARIRELAPELAAVMVEPVQSRHPALQPAEFLHEVRRITEQSETAFIFDEVVTGFRVHPGGAQAHFDIRADLAVYGKVVGGGYSIGLIGGKARFLDALDGGYWQFGDDSIPEVGVTFFAGTFVRHPLALAACKAVLTRMKEEGPALQQRLAEKTHRMVEDLRRFLTDIDARVTIEDFSSFFYISVSPEDPYGGLLFYLLRQHGIHTWEFRPCFLTTSHSDEDIEAIRKAFVAAVSELVRQGLLHGDAVAVERMSKTAENGSPVEGARLGKDQSGMPAWFVPDPERPGKYKKVEGRRVS